MGHNNQNICEKYDEETGFKDLEYYLKHEKPPVMGWTPDCKYPVVYAERGRAVIEISAKEKQVDEFFLFINNYFLNANTNAEKLGLDFKDEEFGINEMRYFFISLRQQRNHWAIFFKFYRKIMLNTCYFHVFCFFSNCFNNCF